MLKLNNFFDEFVGGSLQKDTITSIYGPPGSGKSTICFMYIKEALKQGKKVIYVDTEGGFSVERIVQIYPEINFNDIIVFSPKSFEAQQDIIINLNKEIKNSKVIGLVIVDTLVMLYRLKLGDAPQKINTDLGEQLRLLTEISRTFHIPVLVTNQMYQDFTTKEKRMVGGTLIEYWSKTIIEIDKENDIKSIILKKHKSQKEGLKKLFEIDNSGIIETKNRSFTSLFNRNN